MKAEPKVLNIFEAILMLCDEIDGAYNMAEYIRDSENTAAINQRILRINEEIENLYTLILDVQLGKAFRRSKLKIDADKRSIYLQEIALMLFDLRKKLSDEHYAESFKNFQKVDDLIMKEIDSLSSPETPAITEKTERISDIDFLQGVRTETFKTHVDAITKEVKRYFIVEKEGQIRKYYPFRFLDLILECYYNAIDNTENYNEKMICFVNAESTIKRYIRKYNLTDLGYDFTKIFDDLNDAKKRIEAYKEFGLISPQQEVKVIIENKITTGEDILKLIDQSNVARASNIRHGENLDIGSISEMEDLRKSLKKMANDENFDSSWFIVNLSRLRQWGTFHTVEAASDAINGFEKLGVKAPFYVQNCYDEIEFRTQYINKLIDKKKYLWTAEEVNSYKDQLATELMGYAFNKESEIKYLNDVFHKTVKEIKEIEDTVKKEYGYSIQSLYKGGHFKADKSKLNELFFYCEKQKGNVGEVHKIFLALNNYFDNHNKIEILKELITDSSPSTIPKAKENNKSSITTQEYALFHYYKQEGKYEPAFVKKGNLTKEGVMKKQGEAYGVGGTAFRKAHYLAGKQNNRITKANIGHLEKVIEMLVDFPKGKVIAEIELKKAQLLPY